MLLRLCMIMHYMEENIFCYSLQAFSTEDILKRHIKYCFKINGKQRIKMPKKDKFFNFKNFERQA